MRKIKFLIGILTLVVMTSLFGMFASEENKVYAASSPSMTMSVSDTQIAPGREFTISVITDAGDLINDMTDSDLKEWSGVTLTLYFPIDSPFTFTNTSVKYTPVSSDNDELRTILEDGYDVSFADYSEEGYIDFGFSYNYETDAFTLETVQSFEFIFTCEADSELDIDAPTAFNIEFGGPNDYISIFYIDGYEYGLENQNVDGFDTLQTAEMIIKDKSKNSAFDALTVTGKEAGESWEACDTDNDDTNNTTNIIGQDLEVAASTNEITINATAAENGSIYSVSPGTGSNGSYKVSLNDPGQDTSVTIKIIAEKAADYTVGSAEYNSYIKDYTFTVKRAKYDIATLDGLSFALPGVTGNISLSPTFDSDTTSYTLTLPDDENNIVVVPTITPNVFIQHVKFNGVTLTSGSNNTIDISGKESLEFVVTAQNGDTNTYIVTLDKKSNDNSLAAGYPTATLTKTTGDEAITLSQSGDVYTATVDYTDAVGFEIDAVANDSNATIVFDPASKEQTFASNYAKDTKTITITVTSQSGRTKTYTISVTREKADENVNFSYSVIGTSTGTSYSPESSTTNDLAYYLPESEGSATISISGLADTTIATGTAIEGVTTLPIGNTRYTLTITPENPNKAVTYNVYIYRALDTANSITDIQILDKENGSPLEGVEFAFQSEITSDYTYTTIVVPYEISSVYIKATTASTATLYGTGLHSLIEGQAKQIPVYAQSEYDKKNNPSSYGYKHIIVIKQTAADPDNSLDSLKINGIEFIENGELKENEIRLDRNASGSSVDFTVEASLPTDSLAEILTTSTLGTLTVNNGSTFTVKVNVRAQTKDVKSYEITVVCKEDINTINTITITGTDKDGNPVSIPYTLGSTDIIEVAYEVVSATAEITTDALHATHKGVNTTTLTPTSTGNDTLDVYLISEYGNEGTHYSIKIRRLPADENNKLDSLKINGEELISNGELIKTEIRLDRNASGSSVDFTVEASLPTDSLAEILSTSTLNTQTVNNGSTFTVKVNVRAQSTDIRPYEITVVCKEDVNTINAITVTGTDKDGNPVSIPYTLGSTDIIEVAYEVVNATAQITTDALHATEKGVNTITLTPTSTAYDTLDVYLISEYGTEGTHYLIKIRRLVADENNKLDSLKINGVEYISNGELTVTEIRLDRNASGSSVDFTVEASLPTDSLAEILSTSTLGTQTVNNGSTFTVKVNVRAQSTDIKPYEITVVCKEDINTINAITVTGTDKDGNPVSIPYTLGSTDIIEVPNKVVSATVEITTNALFAVESGVTTYSLTPTSTGYDTLTVYLTSEYGIEGTHYDIKIRRLEADKNNKLDTLSFVIDGQEYITSFDPDSKQPILVTIPNTIDTTVITIGTVSATLPTGSLAKIISGLGNHTLPVPNGSAIPIDVIVEAESNDKNTYRIMVSLEGQKLSDNAKLSSISAKYGETDYLAGVSLDDILAAGTSGYLLELAYNVTGIQVTAIAESEFATVTGNVNRQLNAGDDFVVELYATAQNTTTVGDKYYIHIKVATPLQDAYLTELKFDGVKYEDLTPTTTFVEIRVERSVESIDIQATPCDTASINAVDLGVKSLDIGRNTYTITIIAQDTNVTNPITIVIYRAEDDATINGITISNTNYVFDAAATNPITINVDNTVTSVNVAIDTTATYAKLIGNGPHLLSVGPNPITVKVESDYYQCTSGTKGKVSREYQFIIVRADADKNTYLSDLVVEIKGQPVEFDSAFTKEDQTYIIANVDSDVTSVFVIATPEKSTSTVSPVGNVELNSGTLTSGNTYLITITVTAQNGDTRPYMIYVSRDEVNLDDNNDILSITIKGNDGNVYFQQEYNPIIKEYSVTVPYEVSTIFVTATKPALAGSTIYGDDMYQLIEGDSILVTVYAVSENGAPGTKYNITVSREAPNSDSSLAYIKINGALVDGFSPTKYNYSKFVLYTTSEVDVTAAVATQTSVMRITIENQVHTGLNVQLEPDTQTVVQIIVIAQSGAISTYTISITRASADGVLAELYIEGINFHDNNGNTITYSSEVKTYYATVTYAYENITICGTATDITVEVRGIGTMPLVVGKQEFQIAAIPRTGNVTIYTIIVIRKAEATDNTNVTTFNIVEIDEFASNYSNETNIYDGYHVPSSVNKLTFDIKFTVGEFEDAPTYEVIGNNITFGKNAVIVLITSPDLSTVRTIIIKVYRDDIVVNNVSSTTLSQFATDFNNDVNSYSYKVGSNVSNIDLSFVLAESNANTYEISNTNLDEGHNTITITLKSGDEVNRVIYLNVYRAQSASVVDYCIAGGVIVVLFAAFLIFRKKKRSI